MEDLVAAMTTAILDAGLVKQRAELATFARTYTTIRTVCTRSSPVSTTHGQIESDIRQVVDYKKIPNSSYPLQQSSLDEDTARKQRLIVDGLSTYKVPCMSTFILFNI